jgi:hypothetical protein
LLQSSVESSRQGSPESSTQSSFHGSFHGFFESKLESYLGGDPYPCFSGSRLSPNPPTIRALCSAVALAKSPLRVLVFGLQTATRKLATRGDAARSPGLSNSLITRRLSLCHFFFEAVYRIAGPVLAPYAAPVPAPATAAATELATAAVHALAPAP